MDARAGMGVTNERQQLVTPPEPSVPEHLISPEAAPVRCLPIGAEPQLGGGVHLRVWAPRCREVVVEIEGLEPAALHPRPTANSHCGACRREPEPLQDQDIPPDRHTLRVCRKRSPRSAARAYSSSPWSM